MVQKTILAAALTAIGFMLSASAAAQVYVGAAAGQAKWNVDCTSPKFGQYCADPQPTR